MLLKNEIEYCQILRTQLLEDPIVKNKIKNFTPRTVWITHKELFDAFGDTLTNYSPISLNIIDYWNKNAVNSYVLDAKQLDSKCIYTKWFGFLDGVDDKTGQLSYGFEESKDKALISADNHGDGRFLTVLPGQEAKNVGPDGKCLDGHNRFFVNSLIGVQDKLALNHLGGTYKVTKEALHNSKLRTRLFEMARRNSFPKSNLFGNMNYLFGEEQIAAGKSFATKKGTAIGLLYAGRSAHNAELQGPMTNFMMDINDIEPFYYGIDSYLSRELFEVFVKPLAHPVGMMYDYSPVCRMENYEEKEFIFVNKRYKADFVEVKCLCAVDMDIEIIEPEVPVEFGLKKDDGAITSTCGISSPVTVKPVIDPDLTPCGGEYIPKYHPKIATADGKGLWDEIKEDENGIEIKGKKYYNILADVTEGYDIHKTTGDREKFIRYDFENKNYLIQWNNAKTFNTTIEYYRFKPNTNIIDEETQTGPDDDGVYRTFRSKSGNKGGKLNPKEPTTNWFQFRSIDEGSWTLVKTWENKRHCKIHPENLRMDLTSKFSDKIERNECVDNHNRYFQFMTEDEETKRGKKLAYIGPDADGNHRGFMTTDKKNGGIFEEDPTVHPNPRVKSKFEFLAEMEKANA